MKENRWYTYFALILAVWFALSSWFWAWLAPVLLSYPFGLVALILYFKARASGSVSLLNKAVLIILVLGLTNSIVFLLFMVSR